MQLKLFFILKPACFIDFGETQLMQQAFDNQREPINKKNQTWVRVDGITLTWQQDGSPGWVTAQSYRHVTSCPTSQYQQREDH